MNRYTLFGLLAIVLWSTTVAFSRSLSEAIGPFTTGAVIYILGGLLGLLAASRQPGGLGRLLRLPWRYLWICGSLFVGYMILLYGAVGLAHSRLQVLSVGLANYLWPSLIMLFSIPLLHKRARIWLLPGILLALAGTWLAVLGNEDSQLQPWSGAAENLLPVLLAIGAAVLWGLYSNLSRKWADGGSAVPLFLLVSGLIFWVLRLFSGETSTLSWALAPTLLYMALFPAWLGYLWWDDAMQRGDMLLVTAFSYFTPLLSTLVSLWVLHVQPSLQLGLAVLLVSLGAILSKLGVSDE